MKTYTVLYKVSIWENDQIVNVQTFKTREGVDEFLKEQGNPPLKYETEDKNYYTLEA